MMHSKYRTKRTVVDGIEFASKREAARYRELKLMERAGKISELSLQPRFELQPSFKREGKTIRAIEYVADFVYTEGDDKRKGPRVRVVEDVKGMRTDVYKLKRKMLLFKYPYIVFRET